LEVAQGCIHRWAYRLSGAPGASSQVAEAALQACKDAINRTVELTTKSMPPGFQEERPGTIRQQLWDDFSATANFRVIQARAGHCEIN
jgi:hypothetical protein